MSRPIYETAVNLSNQTMVKMLLQKKWNAILVDMPFACVFDCLAFCFSIPVFIAEIKVRTNKKDAYTTYMLSRTKAAKCLRIARRLKIPFILAVQWKDAIGYVTVTDQHMSVVRMQNKILKTRNDPMDKELCIHIPIDQFKNL